MKFIEEVIVDQFLPTVRAMLAEELRDRGLTQREISDTLGVSQSAVSKYLHDEVEIRSEVRTDDRVRETVGTVADGLVTGDLSRVGALVELEVLIRRLETGGLLADLHTEAMPELQGADHRFAVHDADSRLRARERTLASVRRGVRMLRTASGFAGLIPNVGSNIVEALPDATTIDDVAAIPGRIVDVKGQAMVPAEPEFGVSQHVSNVLLAARTQVADVAGAVNIRYERGILAGLRDAGHDTVEFDPDGSPASVRNALDGLAVDDTFVLYQTGAVGIEPVVYVLGPDAPTVADIVRELL